MLRGLSNFGQPPDLTFLNFMKHLIILLSIVACFGATNLRAQKPATRNIADINIRDPFIMPDHEKGIYYMYRTSTSAFADGKERGGVEVFKSKDLKTWEGPVKVFTVDENNWITGRVWAPEVHRYNGKYYLFATLNSHIEWKKQQEDWVPYTHRATQVFWSNSPEGPFLPFSDLPHTPIDKMALDGTLWVEDGIPYMIYCHEWVQLIDGTMELAKLKPDLSAFDGKSVSLFHASAAEWSIGTKLTPNSPTNYVTDGCFLYRTKTGKLLMIWSSFAANNDYAIGIATSATGKITGPWEHQKEPLFSKDGGHGMMFESLDGKLCIVFHRPNNPDQAERARIFEIEDTGDSLRLVREITDF